ncbi:thioredoxin domain-containing protein 6 [Suncus etruscus]|uniref:thioredoxin domain-containing protein 6 n=1 Tax=Suncus etruscus TaxID=109475 RepID=UPI00210FA479|nr:thioredoxin domain-containing protein 6 [Suncus etruscus]
MPPAWHPPSSSLRGFSFRKRGRRQCACACACAAVLGGGDPANARARRPGPAPPWVTVTVPAPRASACTPRGGRPAVRPLVDVYQGWCGPCKPAVSLFQKLRLELGLDLLHFALAEADSLDVLEKYRGRCEPTFLFYAGGELVAVVRGANAPLLEKTILDQLEAEKKVLAEGGERKAIKDEALSGAEERSPHEQDDGDDEDVASSGKPYTLAIIKPEAVAHGKADEIIMKIQEANFDIMTHEERTMTEAEVQILYQHRAGEEIFEKLVRHMSTGPSHLLILTSTKASEDVVTAWQTLMGPCDPNVARREQPDSLRAQYGTELPFNAVHGSQDSEAARLELSLLFPNRRAWGGDFSEKGRDFAQSTYTE